MKRIKRIVLLGTIVLALSIMSSVIAAGLPNKTNAITGFTYGSRWGVISSKRYGYGFTNALSPTTGKSSRVKGELQDQYGSKIDSCSAGSPIGTPYANTKCYDYPGNNDYIVFFTTHEGFYNGEIVDGDYRIIYQLGMK